MRPAMTKEWQGKVRHGLFRHEVTQQISDAAGSSCAGALLHIFTVKVIIIN
jgi:hypothetical protein